MSMDDPTHLVPIEPTTPVSDPSYLEPTVPVSNPYQDEEPIGIPPPPPHVFLPHKKRSPALLVMLLIIAVLLFGASGLFYLARASTVDRSKPTPVGVIMTPTSAVAPTLVPTKGIPFSPAHTPTPKSVSTILVETPTPRPSPTGPDYQATANAENEMQAVIDANNSLGGALSQLNSDSNTLASFSETSTLNSYATSWQTMQNDYATEQKDAQAGCGENGYNYNQVTYDANQVSYDENRITYDDNQLSYDKNQYDSELSPVQNDIQTVQQDWSQLQQAEASSPTGTSGATYTSSDVNNALQNAQKAESKSQGVWQSAESSAAQYDQKASSLNSQAQALPGKMGC
jgi:hypothetical protein